MKRALFVLLALGGLFLTAPALGQGADQVMVVPFSQLNPGLPHPAHEQARITLKATVRNTSCGSGYYVWWDVNRNGNYDDDYRRSVSRNSTLGSIWDIGRTFLVPNVDRDQSLNINVRVRNRCNNNDSFATFRLFVYDFTPSNNPANWTSEQLEIMTLMGAQESMWYLHRKMGSFVGNFNDPQMRGQNAGYYYASPLQMWLMIINGHLPAYPPGRIDTFGHALPDGWAEANDRRWNVDPYAESTVRVVNRLTDGAVTGGIPAGEEDRTCGWNPNGTERSGASCPNRWDGNAGDRVGMRPYNATNIGHDVYQMGISTGSLAVVLPALAGTYVQRGGQRGMRWEKFMQQVVDWLGQEQFDGGCAKGGWYYRQWHGSAGCNYMDQSTTQWGYIGMESSAVAGGPYGIIVNNRHKYRIADNLVFNQRADGGASYRSSYARSDFKLTGGSFVGARWLGLQHMDRNDGSNPFPGYGQFSRGRLRQAYDAYISYSTYWFNRRRVHGTHWLDGNWQHGDYRCGNTSTVYNAGRCGNTYTMYSHMKGYRTGQPELSSLGGIDWARLYNTYYVRAQDRSLNVASPLTSYNEFGRVYDTYCEIHSVTCAYGSGYLGAAMGGLVLTPTIFNPKPVAIATVAPPTVTEGCSGGNAGQVVFDHSDSFHPNADARIVAYQWDVDANNGLWWDPAVNAQADFEGGENDGGTFAYTYTRRGTYTATLRIVDNSGQEKLTTVQVTVNASENVPPAAAHGGPYTLEVGGALALRGSATDANQGCGDTVSAAWDLDDDGAFDDANTANPTVGWGAIFANLPVGRAVRIRIRVTDAAGLTAIEETTLTIYPADPIAAGRANPNPAACQQEVSFDANASRHPNPQRTIAQYEWDVDGQPGFDGGGVIFRYTYQRFGTYAATLRVTDDLGRQNSVSFDVDVNLGNVPPVARVASNDVIVLEGSDLVLDGRNSSDANTPCGDSIVSYEWDVNGNGAFNNGGIDQAGARVTVPWAIITANMEMADPHSGLPTNTVTLRVTDSFGASATTTITVRVYPATPEAIVVQSPNPAPINLVTGFSNPTLDGRESRSPIPGMDIVRYSWDLDNNNTFEVVNQPVVEFNRIYNPIPGPGNLPVVFIKLKVVDADGRENITTYQIVYRVPPTPPTADADPTDPPERGYHILLGDGVRLDGSQSFDPDADEFGDLIEAYRWDLTYVEADGFQMDVETTADGQEAEPRLSLTAAELAAHGVDAVGSYTIHLQVEDTTNLTNEDSAPLTVHQRNPTAMAVANPDPAACNGNVTLDARGSNHTHPNVQIAGYAWDLDGDGQYDDAEGAVINHRFPQFSFNGPALVGLRVEDSNGNVSTTVIEVDVNLGNRAPLAVAGGYRDADGDVVGPYAVGVGSGLALDADGSLEPDAACGDEIVSYQWDVNNDGVIDVEGDTPNLTWAQLQALNLGEPGQYEVRLVVTDRFGVHSENVVTLIIAAGPEAHASATPNRTGCENIVTFDASASTTDGPAGQGFDLVGYHWDLDGDGQFDDAEGERFQVPAVSLPNAQGQVIMTARLRVTDESGRTDVTEIVVVIDVQNLPPVANAGGPYRTGPVGASFSPVQLDGRASTDPNAPCDEIVTYKWDIDGDGRYGRDNGDNDPVGALIGNFVNPAWQINTVQTVRLIVCDVAGACSHPGEAEIEVLDEAPPSGDLLSPRADQDVCLGGQNFNVVFTVSDPAGDNVRVRVLIAGQVRGEVNVDTPNDGSAVQRTIAINPNGVAEGTHEIILDFDDNNGGRAQVTSGGRMTFDRTAPSVVIGRDPAENVCFPPNQVPEPTFEVTDALDATPNVQQATTEDGCQRTLRVTATDACGNAAQAERSYRIGGPIEALIAGVEEGALVAQARITWEVDGPVACANSISGTLSHNGGAAQPYPENTLVNQPGTYALTVTVTNCQGVARRQIVNFTVNAPPVAVAIPDGHPAQDPNNALAYLVNEGEGLQVDGTASRAPEVTDSIVAYNWDFDGDGNVDAEGQVVAFPTADDGVFNGRLTVTDSLGASSFAAFQVTVIDAEPIASAGGPYQVSEGVVLEFDGTGSRAGSAADLITRYDWDWGDGTAHGIGADLDRPTHTYVRNGVYNVRLTVTDEDSSHSVVVVVTVRDVDPIIVGITPPEDVYEIRPMVFNVEANPGSPNDVITRYEWDIDGDGNVEYAGANMTQITHQFRDAGQYTMTVRVRDGDSSAVEAILVNVREIRLGELIQYTGEQRDTAYADVERYNAGQRMPLRSVDDDVAEGLWAERYNRRGNTFIATQRIIAALVRAQAEGIDFGLELWALSRQLMREVTRLRTAIIDQENGPAENSEAIVLADGFLDDVVGRFGGPNFEDDVYSARDARTANNLWDDANEAYYWLAHSVDQCNQYNGFGLDGSIQDAVARVAAANETNNNLTLALNALAADLQAYVDSGADEEDFGPGRDAIITALETLDTIREVQPLDINTVCPEGQECVTDRQALEMELLAVELVARLQAVAAQGVYVRGWQNCLVLAVKFRIELSILRVEFVCGRNTRVAQRARASQSVGLEFVDEHHNAEALNYYIDNERKCLLIETYNDCLVPAYPEVNLEFGFPEECLEEE